MNGKKRKYVDHRLTMLPLLAPLEQKNHCLLFGEVSSQDAITETSSLIGSFFTFAARTDTPQRNTKHDLNPTDITPRQLASFLDQGNSVFFLAHTWPATHWRPDNVQSRCEALRLIDWLNLTVQQEFYVAPHLYDARWVFPCSNVLAVAMMDLYQPSLTAGKGRKFLYRTLSNLKMTCLWTPYRVLTAAKSGVHAIGPSLPLLISRILNRPGIQLGFFTGTPGYYHKITAQVMSDSGEVIAYGKIASTDQAASILAREAQNLTYMGNCGIESFFIPSVLWTGKLHDYSILLQSAPRRSDPGPLRLTEKHISALSELHRKTAKRLFLKNGKFFKEIKRRVDWLEKRLDRSTHGIFKTAVFQALSRLSHTEIPHGVCHRDFTPWNTKVVNNSLYIFDWEWSVLNAPPFIDLFHFLISAHIVVNQYDADSIMTRLFLEDNDVIMKYAQAIGMDNPDLWPSFLILYLVDLLTFYSQADILETNKDSFENREFRVRYELLKGLLKATGV